MGYGVRNFFLEAFSIFRKQKRAEKARTQHYYALRAPSIELPPAEKVIRELESYGYQIELEEGDGWTLRERRVGRDYGWLVVKPPEQLEHCMLMQVETADNGPELYDELASYLIAVLGRDMASLSVREVGRPETTASAIADKLPDSPYGLIGVENLR
ncbi:MAG: hypothetical protein KJO07_20375 [Deltaproteobacteria bacterium]|nr:hypothetical protein [Deltaproteobacteria bacterium]